MCWRHCFKIIFDLILPYWRARWTFIYFAWVRESLVIIIAWNNWQIYSCKVWKPVLSSRWNLCLLKKKDFVNKLKLLWWQIVFLKTVCFETRVTFAKQGDVCHLCSCAFRNLKPDGVIFVIKYSEKLHQWTINNLNFDQTGLRKICLTNFLPWEPPVSVEKPFLGSTMNILFIYVYMHVELPFCRDSPQSTKSSIYRIVIFEST